MFLQDFLTKKQITKTKLKSRFEFLLKNTKIRYALTDVIISRFSVMFKSTKLTVIKYSQNNTNMIWKQYLTWQKTTKYNQYQWTELNTFSKISGRMQINGKPGNKQNSTCTTVINSAFHYYNCRMDNIPLYLEPTNKTAT